MNDYNREFLDPNFSLAQGMPPPVDLSFLQTTPQQSSLLGPQDQYGLAKPKVNSTGEGFNFTDAMGNFSLGAQGLSGLAGAYSAYKQLGLMKDQLNMQKNFANRNVANTAATTNRMLDDRAAMAAQLTSGADYGTPEYLAAKKRLQTTVDGSPVA